MTYPPESGSNAANLPRNPIDDLFQQGLELHNTMNTTHDELRGRGAFARICDLYYGRLIYDLNTSKRGYHNEATFADAAWDALHSYVKNPAQYKPDLPNALSLYKYLLMSAKGDFKNILAREKKHAHVDSLTNSVDNHDGSLEHETDIPADVDIEQDFLDALSPIWDRLNQLLPEPIDQELIKMMMDGIRETEAYAEVLGISHLPSEERADEVKKNKDRIKKKILRTLAKRELLPND